MVTHTTILSAIISFGLLAAPVAAERLGGIDMNRACRDQYGPALYAVRGGNSCNDWYCDTNIAGGFPIDTPRACVTQYNTNAYAQCVGGANDWSCYRA